MEALKKNDDCYFYYYSSCMKGDSCPFRHEPTALGIETVCNFWKQGKCSKLHCNFRHMEVRKNRNVIPCYWESQPSGCRKPHCPFQHKSSRDGLQTENESIKDLILPVGSSVHDPQDRSSSADREGSELDSSSANFVSSPPVDPLVVNFEEESDNESVPSTTPVKRGGRNIHIKTLEEIRLERIQAESAAFYQYDDSETEATPSSSTTNTLPSDSPKTRLGARDAPEIELRKKITGRRSIQNGESAETTVKAKESSEFKVLSLQEIRDRKRRKEEDQNDNTEEKTSDIKCPQIQIINRIKAIIENNIEKETTDTVDSEEHGNSSRKRSHSPVVFDIGGKKIKSVDQSIDKKDTNIKCSPPKPIVAVAGRKRPHHEDNTENVTTTVTENNVTSTSTSESSIRPARKIWRSSRQMRKIEEENLKNISDNSNNSDSNISNNNVFTRKLRLKKNIVQPIISSSIIDDNNCKNGVNNDSLDKLSINKSVPDNDSCDKNNEITTSCMQVEQSKTTKLACKKEFSKINPPASLHVVTPSQSNGDLDVDLSLLSPTQEGDMSLSMSRGADDILQDIDDLLND